MASEYEYGEMDIEFENEGSQQQNEEEPVEEPEEEEHAEEEHEIEEEKMDQTKRSWVWAYFTYDKAIQKARCNHCKALICTNKGSTSGMSTHMKTKHKITKNGEENQGQKQLTLQESIKNSSNIMVSF
jgi:hypothetical protein